MRIVAGEFRGRVLNAPAGRNTRPTTDRVREGLFSSLCSRMDLRGCNVLDAFAGSGALGLEALSRGASHVTFCERDARAFFVLKDNVESLGVQERCELIRTNVLTCAPAYSTSYSLDLIFLDPPYAMSPIEVGKFLKTLEGSETLPNNTLSKGAFAVYEHDKCADVQILADTLGETWQEITTKTYGKTGVTFLRFLSELDEQ